MAEDERTRRDDAVPGHGGDGEPGPEPTQPEPVTGPLPDPPEPETEEEREARELWQQALHGTIVITPEQARRLQHQLGLPDAALPANDAESHDTEET
jgi:hypothetical protein